MNVLKILRNDHSNVRDLIGRFGRAGKSSHDKRGEIFEQLRRQLQIHSRAEEEIFYPAIKALNGVESQKLVSEALKEHRQIDELLTRISRLKPTDKNFDDRIETLFETIEHHLDEEEGEIFQFVEENCSPDQLDEIGMQMEDRKRAIDRQMAA
jgi:hemerythrin superfamily protein